MACKNSVVLLGFDDEIITDKHVTTVNFTTNKIGGKPDYPSPVNLENPICTLCQLPKLLIVQIYAPLENSLLHRTLYLFACINPNCWNHSESWSCIRVESLASEGTTIEVESSAKSLPLTSTDYWCRDEDDWGDANLNNEENGNNLFMEILDEDDESLSTEESLRAALGNMIVDDRNANIEVVSGAQGVAENHHSSPISAEIEGDEGDTLVSIDSPTIPQRNLHSLLEEVSPLPQEIKRAHLQFIPHFISVSEEQANNSHISDHHVRELLAEYQQNNLDEFKSNFKNSNSKLNDNDNDEGRGETSFIEKYEKGFPAHGDRTFHHFVTKIQNNPGQILRYSRESKDPLLLYSLEESPKNCEYCGGPRIFEFQILPTIISKLKLISDLKGSSRLDFGTVLIFTCQNDCYSNERIFSKEEVVLQFEKSH